MPLNVLSDKDIVVYALYLLNGYGNRLHTEDIVLKCYELAPSRFSWAKYPQYPDIQPVRFALEKSMPFILGNSERKSRNVSGWRLSTEGIQWINENITRIERQLDSKQVPTHRLAINRKMNTLLTSDSYRKFLKSRDFLDIAYVDFIESLTCTINTSPEILIERFEQIYSTALMLKQNNVKEYSDSAREQFAGFISGGKDEKSHS